MKKRLFVALDLPERIQDRIQRLCSGLPNARWVSPDQLHLTLCFIGEVDGVTFQEIREALAEVTAEPFSMHFDGVGFFPPRGKPRVVWVGVAKNKELSNLQRKIHNQLVRLQLPLEKRKFHPHVTFGRLKNTPVSKVGQYLERNSLFITDDFSVDVFRLNSSTLSSKGAVHVVESDYMFGE